MPENSLESAPEMQSYEIDWSKSGDDFLEEVRRWQKAVLRENIELVDKVIKRLEKDDIFDHNLFSVIRRRTATRAEWAAWTGLSAGTIRNYEKSETYPSIEYRKKISRGLRYAREYLVVQLDKTRDLELEVNVDPGEAKDALGGRVLSAALTDFEFDHDEQVVRAVPFRVDEKELNLAELNADRADLLESLAEQADRISSSLKQGANANVARLVQAMEDYAREARRTRANPRKIIRWGQNIARASASDDLAFGISGWDKSALDGFVSDHQELTRLYYKEALRRAQDVEAFRVDDDSDLPTSDFFRDIADKIAAARDGSGQPLFDDDISVLLKDIAREIEEHEDNETVAVGENQKAAFRKRRIEAIKNGGILLGRFVFFASFFVIIDPLVALSTAGSIASIIGLLKAEAPGSLRKLYDRIREALPFLPRFPSS